MKEHSMQAKSKSVGSKKCEAAANIVFSSDQPPNSFRPSHIPLLGWGCDLGPAFIVTQYPGYARSWFISRKTDIQININTEHEEKCSLRDVRTHFKPHISLTQTHQCMSKADHELRASPEVRRCLCSQTKERSPWNTILLALRMGSLSGLDGHSHQLVLCTPEEIQIQQWWNLNLNLNMLHPHQGNFLVYLIVRNPQMCALLQKWKYMETGSQPHNRERPQRKRTHTFFFFYRIPFEGTKSPTACPFQPFQLSHRGRKAR